MYDLYAFLSTLNNVKIFPCSYGFKINDKFIEKTNHYYINGITASRINEYCKKLDIDIICLSWLLEIRELFDILGKLKYKIMLFPHGEHKILKKLRKYKNCVLVHGSIYSKKILSS